MWQISPKTARRNILREYKSNFRLIGVAFATKIIDSIALFLRVGACLEEHALWTVTPAGFAED
jgi:hypothetical protein